MSSSETVRPLGSFTFTIDESELRRAVFSENLLKLKPRFLDANGCVFGVWHDAK